MRYRFLSREEGGRSKGPPTQGYRPDWRYDGDGPNGGIWAIYPVFEDDAGNDLPHDVQASVEGNARMNILNPAFRDVHRKRIAIGVRAHMLEGPIAVAEAVVIEIGELA